MKWGLLYLPEIAMLLISSMGIHFYINCEWITSDAHLTSGVGYSWRFTVVHSLSQGEPVTLYHHQPTYLSITTNEQQKDILAHTCKLLLTHRNSVRRGSARLKGATSLFYSLLWFSDSEEFMMKSCLVIV